MQAILSSSTFPLPCPCTSCSREMPIPEGQTCWRAASRGCRRGVHLFLAQPEVTVHHLLESQRGGPQLLPDCPVHSLLPVRKHAPTYSQTLTDFWVYNHGATHFWQDDLVNSADSDNESQTSDQLSVEGKGVKHCTSLHSLISSNNCCTSTNASRSYAASIQDRHTYRGEAES